MGASGRRSSLLATCAIVLLAVVACGGGAQQTAQGPIRIGVVTDLSGDTAAIGKQLQAAAKFAVDQINAAGGVKTSSGLAKLQLFVEDSHGVPENAVAAFTKLVTEDKVVGVVGALTTPPTLAVAQQAERDKIPVVVDTAAGEKLVNSGLHYLVRLSQGARQEGQAQVGVLDTLGQALGHPIKNIAFLGWDGTSFVDDELAQIKQDAAAKGITVTKALRFSSGKLSYASEIAQIKASNPDAVLWCVLGIPEAVTIVRNYVQQGLDPKKVPLVNCSVSVTDPSFAKSAGALANGLYTVQGWFSGLKGTNTALWSQFKASAGFDIYDLPAFEVQSVYIFKAAIEQCSCTDPDKINTTLHQLNLAADSPNYVLQPGTGIQFDANGVNQKVLVGIYQWQSGQLQPIWPSNIASAQPLT